MRQLMLFCVGGVIGFIIDAGIVQWLVTVHHGNPYTSRLLSFVCAGTGTWLFNRHYTFQGVRLYGKFGEWARYMFAMTGGFSVNYTVYSFLRSLLRLGQWAVCRSTICHPSSGFTEASIPERCCRTQWVIAPTLSQMNIGNACR